MHNHRLTPQGQPLSQLFCDATSDPVLRQITLKFCAKYLSKLHPSPSAKSFAEGILYALGDPLWTRGNTFAKELRILEICEKCKVRVLALDDFQHLVDTRSNVPREAADLLKDLLIRSQGNKAHLSVGAAGLQRSLAVFEQNEQLRGRFGTPIKFGPLEWEIENRPDKLSCIH
jgi:hypothetical protein